MPSSFQEIRLLLTADQGHVHKFVDPLQETGVLQLKALVDNLSPENCLDFRRLSSEHAVTPLTEACDAFVVANFSKMLSEEKLVSLPRVQVNVDVSKQLKDFDARSLDSDVIERIVPAVVHELSQHSTAYPTPCQFVEEKLVEMELLSDLSVQMADCKLAKTASHLAPEKPLSEYISLSQKNPSPVRRHHLGAEDGGKPCDFPGTWEILVTHTIGAGALSVVRCTTELLVLNVQIVLKGSANAFCPISPTTGAPMAVNDAFFSQMLQSRSGFGLALLDDSLMSVGGFGRGGVFQSCECFNLGINSWVPSSKLTTPRARLAAVQLEDKVYALGGSDGKADLSSVEVFSNKSKVWKKLSSSLCTARSDFSATVLDGLIYAIGGVYYSSLLRSAEVFDPLSEEWKPIASMSTPRRGVATVSCNGSIYAIGGQASSWGCLNSVERYDPVANQWQKVAPMAMHRRNACAVATGDRIYVIGGYNGSSAVSVVEVYDPVSNKWGSVNPMALKRSNASAVLFEDAVYVVGGFSGSIFFNSVEKYDLKSGQWTSYNRS